MAQTTNSIWGGAGNVGISTDGSTWTDISGHSQKVTPGGGNRRVGEKWTFDGEDPIVKVGKKNSRQTRVDIIYTEQSADAFEAARAQFEAAGGGTLYVRWSPGGGDVGDRGYTTDAGFVSELQFPEQDSEEDGPLATFFVLYHASITSSLIATAW